VSAEGGTFACDACGKRYAWKPQLAGKKAKCKCGATITVPQALAPQRDAPDDLYDVVDTSPPATVVRQTVAPAAATVAQPAGSALNYRGARAASDVDAPRDRFAYSEMTHPPRDLYIPLALGLIGLGGIIAWAIRMGAGEGMLMTVVVAAHVATLIKTAVLIGLAFLFAPVAGVSFGDLRTAVLKFSAIVIFTDAIGLWFDELVEMAGGTPNRRVGWRIFWLQMFMIGMIIAYLCYYLFDMDGEDAKTFAFPFAIASQVVGFVLWLALAAVLDSGGDGAAAAPATAGGPGPAPGGAGAPAAQVAPAPPPMAAPGIPLQANARDREIERMIGSGGRMMTEANEYNQSQPQRSKREPELVNTFYAAGAKRVYFDFGGKHAVVQLPDTPDGRTRCFSVAEGYRAQKNPQSPAPMEQGQRFLEVPLAPSPSR